MSFLSTLRTPEMVFSRMGKNAPMKTRKTAEFRPMPNQSSASPIQAMGGIGRMISTIGSTT